MEPALSGEATVNDTRIAALLTKPRPNKNWSRVRSRNNEVCLSRVIFAVRQRVHKKHLYLKNVRECSAIDFGGFNYVEAPKPIFFKIKNRRIMRQHKQFFESQI